MKFLLVILNFFKYYFDFIVRFYEVFCDVEPKRKALEDANQQLKGNILISHTFLD